MVRAHASLSMIQSLELMSKFHAMCECDTWEEISRKLNKTRADVESELGELELILGKKLIHRSPSGEVTSSFSGRFFMPTDAGMKWYLLIGELLRNVALEDRSAESDFLYIARDLLQSLSNKSPSSTGFFVTFSFFSSGVMQNLKIFSNDFLSFYFLEPILAKLLVRYPDLTFSTFGYEYENLNDFDAYFLHYAFPMKDFGIEVLTEGKLGLYAHPSYIERVGFPKELADLPNHNIIRCKSMHATYDLGVKKFKAIEEYILPNAGRRYIEVDSVVSLRKIAELGAGIVSCTDTGAKKAGIHLQKIPPLKEEDHFVYRKYNFGYHHKHVNAPLMREIISELREALR